MLELVKNITQQNIKSIGSHEINKTDYTQI